MRSHDRDPSVTASGKAVFLSYASEDADAARRICEALRSAGLVVWFDQSELRGGDAWDHRIRQQIRDCTLFLPVISAHTQARTEGYFRLEWRLAEERTHLMGRARAFIVPVSVDQTPERDADVPESFMKVHWTCLPGGETPASFCARIEELLAGRRGPGPAPVHSPMPAAAAPRGFSWKRWALLGAAALVVVAGCIQAWRLLQPKPSTPVTVPVVAAAPEKSVAVLPFENRSGESTQDFYADGLTDELTTALARISGLKVIARASAALYKGSEKRPAEIARELGVATLVTGSVLRAGGRVRYSAALVSADTERNLWAESYERSERDVLTLQSEVARAIAKAIAVQLSPTETERLSGARTVDPRAFDEYLMGRALWNQRTEQGVRAGLEHFEKATRLAPDFALGYAGVADSHIILGVYGYDPPRTAFPLAKEAALQAMRLDPGAGEPHASLGDILLHYDWDWAASEREHQKAIALAPAFATAYLWGSEAQVLNGDMAGALVRLERAQALDPLSMIIRTTLAKTLGTFGRREQAVAELNSAITLDPTYPRARLELALQLLALGRTDQALSAAQKVAELAPDNLPALAALGLCLGRSGRTDEARALLKRLESERKVPFTSSLELARIAAGLRDPDLTIRYLERAVDAREGFLPFIGGDAEFAFLRNDPRFLAVERTIGIGLSHGTPVAEQAAANQGNTTGNRR
jgi:TolB-like protein/Flp pilus assembly protein TadD